MAFWRGALALLACFLALESSRAWIPASSGLSTATAPYSSSQLLMAAAPILEDWKITKLGEVTGVVKNHPAEDIDDGDTITTSPLADPDSAAARKIVVTESGSKYKLGQPLVKSMPKNKNGAIAAPTKKKAAAAAPAKKERAKSWSDIKKEFKLNGDKIGKNYLLSGNPQRSTSGRSMVWNAYKVNNDGIPTGERLKIKISPLKDKMKAEAANYRKLGGGGRFVKMYEYLPVAGEATRFVSQSALVIESGGVNLKEFLERRRSGLEGKALRDAAAAAVQCLQAVHRKRLVWTDLKPENFVVFTDEDDLSNGMVVKGIDLESAIPVRGNPIDYSPEACPPEFARALLKGEGPDFILDFTYDIWSFGILLYEIATGRSVFKGKDQSQITRIISTTGYEVDVSAVEDPRLRDLISKCCQIDPKKRISVTQILLHPYFLTTGIGGFSF